MNQEKLNQDSPEVKELVNRIIGSTADEGKMIHTGWLAFKRLCIPATASPNQVEGMRRAFMCGAQHAFAGVMSMLGSEGEPTEQDMERMRLLDLELREFVEEMRSANDC
jgi:hypothetical protein